LQSDLFENEVFPESEEQKPDEEPDEEVKKETGNNKRGEKKKPKDKKSGIQRFINFFEDDIN
jgi:hypothetical protein